MSYVSNKTVNREFSNSGQAMLRRNDRYFVERNEDGGWSIVEPTDRFVSTNELGADFGLWKDKKVTKGHLWWKKTIRPLDGKVDKDEVIPMGQVLRQQHDSPIAGTTYPNRAYKDYHRLVAQKSELTVTPDGGTLKTDWETLYRHTEHSLSTVSNRYLV